MAYNRPIDGIDLDGEEWSSEETTASLSHGGKTTIVYTIRLSLFDTKNQLHLTKANEVSTLNEIKAIAESILDNPNAKGTTQDPIVKTNIIFSDEEGSFKVKFRDFVNVSGIDKKGSTFTRGDPINSNGYVTTIGDINNNEINIALSNSALLLSGGSAINSLIKTATICELGRTLAHELDHTAGLFHPFDVDNDLEDVDNDNVEKVGVNQIKFNLMNSQGNTVEELQSNEGTNLVPSQREKIKATVKAQQKPIQ